MSEALSHRRPPVLIQGREVTLEEANEFLGAKRRRGEPVQVSINRFGRATAALGSDDAFSDLRRRLAEVPAFGQALEALERLEYDVRRSIAFPRPDQLLQIPTGEIGLAWKEGLKVIVGADAIVGIVTRSGEQRIGRVHVAAEIIALAFARAHAVIAP